MRKDVKSWKLVKMQKLCASIQYMFTTAKSILGHDLKTKKNSIRLKASIVVCITLKLVEYLSNVKDCYLALFRLQN